jgi:transcription antitermination factor NusG
MRAWHTLRAKPSAEGRVLIGIGACGLDGFLPVELVRKHYRGTRERPVSWSPLFPLYVFARCDPGTDHARLCDIDGVQGPRPLLPAAIPDEVIETIRRHEQMGVFDRTRQARFTAGDTVRLTGPFAGMIAKIRSARPRRRLGLLVELAGLPFRVIAPADKLEEDLRDS